MSNKLKQARNVKVTGSLIILGAAIRVHKSYPYVDPSVNTFVGMFGLGLVIGGFYLSHKSKHVEVIK